jgi:rod shape determining protein RodA
MKGRVDWLYLAAAVLLAGAGLASLWMYLPPTKGENLAGNHFVKQAVFLGIALVVMALTMIPNYLWARKLAYLPYALLLGLLIALPFMVRATNGARGWIPLGPVKFQPAEVMKIGAVLALARWLSLAKDLTSWRSLIVPFALAGVPAGIIFIQPDLGNAMLFFPAVMTMLYTAGARTKCLLIVLCCTLAVIPLAYQFGMKPYQRARLTSFLWPEDVPRDIRYQQEQSTKACAAGGFAGREFTAQGDKVPIYVPERHTDFVYSIVAEEFGLVGSTLVLVLLGVLFWRSSVIAGRTTEPFGRLVVVGLMTFLAMQVFINIGMNIGIAPITGLTLPFVSYGGSSLLTCFVAAGLVLNVAARWVPTFSSRDLDVGHKEIRSFAPQPEKWLVH